MYLAVARRFEVGKFRTDLGICSRFSSLVSSTFSLPVDLAQGWLKSASNFIALNEFQSVAALVK
jgi:hypothetical protein